MEPITAIKTITELMNELKTGDQLGKIIFIKAASDLYSPCIKILPFYDSLVNHWVKYGVSLSRLDFDIDEAEQLSQYFHVTRIPSFICLLPHHHSTLTRKELRLEGADPKALHTWMTNIMQKWLTQSNPINVSCNTKT
jgi:hypothetical protein